MKKRLIGFCLIMLLVVMTLVLGYYNAQTQQHSAAATSHSSDDSSSEVMDDNHASDDSSSEVMDDNHASDDSSSEVMDDNHASDDSSSEVMDDNHASDDSSSDVIEMTDGDHASSDLHLSSGRLAYVGSDGNVYVTTPDRSSTIAVTNDATAAPQGAGFSYHRISWSPDGQLAFAGVAREGDKASNAQLYVSDFDGEPARLVGESNDHFVIYIYWSPKSCPERPTCQQLAYLIEEGEDIALRLVQMDGDEVSNRAIGTGWPFYYSWQPDGNSILWHNNGSARHSPDSRLALYDLENDQTEALSTPLGLFFAPAWSPKGDKWLAVSAEEGARDDLQLFSADEAITLDSAEDSQTVFAWSPDGTQIAYARRGRSTDPFFGPIHIYDVNTGESTRLTDVGFRTLGFFWSPDGQRLAYLTWLPLENSTWSQWRVYDLANNTDRGFKAFNPSSQMHFVISSFNQYAQSHRFWSPDGRYLVYADRDNELVERVWIIDTIENESGTEATQIGYGSFGTWSWE